MEFSECAANKGKVVIISALDANFLRGGFCKILELIPKAEKVKKLQAICKNCSANASFSFRTTNSSELECIGGAESYKPLCRECFNNETALKKIQELKIDDRSMTEQKTAENSPELVK